MKKQNPSKVKMRIISVFLTLIMLLELLPTGIVLAAPADSGDAVPNREALVTAAREKAENEVSEALRSAGHEKIPTLAEYYGESGAPKIISLTEFTEKVGVYSAFSAPAAEQYKDYKIRIDTADELYMWSQNCNSLIAQEKNFYLSASFILGNSIEYQSGSYAGEELFYYRPVGTVASPFNGTFDGQGFEIRNLAFDTKNTPEDPYGYGLFGVIGESGTVQNLGLNGVAGMIVEGYAPVAVRLGMIAVINQGTICKAYCDLTQLNGVEYSANCGFAGIAYENQGSISDVYYAGEDCAEGESAFLHDPVCAENSGTIQNAYYDSTVYQQAITGASSAEASPITALSTVELKTLGQNDTEDAVEFANDVSAEYHWHIVRLALSDRNVTTLIANINQYFAYPKLYGFSSELKKLNYNNSIVNDLEISTPADLIYFSTSPEYIVAHPYYQFVFRLTKNVDMSGVAEDAYVPSHLYFYGHFTGKTAEAAQYNHCYSIINLRITRPGVLTEGGRNYYYYGLIGRGNYTYISDPDVEGQRVGEISNVNFIGGGIATGDYDFSVAFSAGTTQLYMGMAGGLLNNGSVVNISSTADVTYSDEALTIKAYIGGIFGYVSCERMENIVNYGTVCGGTHAYTEGYHGNSSILGGVAGSGNTTQNNSNITRYHMKNVVNYGSVFGIGVYGALSTDPERMQADHTDNNSTKYINRAIYYYTGGVFGTSGNGQCVDIVANFGEVCDVPSEKKEVPIYDDENNQVGTEMRYIGIVPDENAYILNYYPYFGGVVGSGLTPGNNADTFYGFDLTAEKVTRDTGFYNRCYNFGSVTAAESRCGEVGGVRGYGNGVIHQYNFGTVTCYSLNTVYGVQRSGKSYDSANYGDIYMDNSSRSGRQTHFTTNRSYVPYGYSSGSAVRCNNYGNITFSYGGYVPWSWNVTTMNTPTYPDLVFSGVGYTCTACSNYGNIAVNTFDKWTGEYSYVDMTADHFLKGANGQTLYTSFDSAYAGQSFRTLYVSGVAIGSAENCMNFGNIQITGTPETYDRLAHTYDELVEKLGYSPNAERRKEHQGATSGVINGWDSRTVNGVNIVGTGLTSDAAVRNMQHLYRSCNVSGISWTNSDIYTLKGCVNFGDISIQNFGHSQTINGIAYSGRFSDCVNKGNLTVETNAASDASIRGIAYASNYVNNCMNTGNLTVNGADCSAYIAGILSEVSGTLWNISDCVNLGDITIHRDGKQRQRTGSVSLYAAGIQRYLRSDQDGSFYGNANYGNIRIESDVKRYVSDEFCTTCNTVWLEYYRETNQTTYYYDRSGDSIYAGGVLSYVENRDGTAAHTVNVNSCINQGNVSVDYKQYYPTSVFYTGGVVGYVFGGTSHNFGGTPFAFSNLVNHGDISETAQQEQSTTNSGYDKHNVGGIFGYFYGAVPAAGKPAVRTVVENLLNTGAVRGTVKKADGSDASHPCNVGGLAGRLHYGSYNRESNLTIKNVLNYSETPLIGYQQSLTDWPMSSDENGNGVTLANGNTTYSNRITLENLYSASTDCETIKIGALNMKDANGEPVPQKTYTVGVITTDAQKNGEKVSTDADDARTYQYIYPVADENGAEIQSAFFKRDAVDADTGVVCALGYLDYGALSNAYREKYSRLNGGSYDTSEPEEPEDQTSPEYAAYQQWFKQLGGFVLASAKPGVSGSDYFPNQFIPSKVKPDGSADTWYTEDIRTRLGTDCAQIDLLDLNDLLQFVVTNGTTETIAKRYEKTETENTLYVYVQNEIAEDALSVLSYQISSGAEVVFYRDAAHTDEIADIYNESILLQKTADADGNEQYAYSLYARVTAQNGDTADWVIQLQSVSAEPSLSVTSALITDSAAGVNASYRTYYPNISEEALASQNFWDYPAYYNAPLMSLQMETKNVESGYNLYDHMTPYYYVQNAYGITEAGVRNGLGKSTCLADLLANDPAYTADANGDIRYNGEIVAELIYVGKDYSLVPETEEAFAVKAEKYSCVKAEDGATDYYLENEGANILWEFVRADGKTLISRGNADFFSAENGALKLKYNNKSHFSWVNTNTVQTSEEADINGNLPGSYLLYSAGSSGERKGGYFELEFEFSNGSKESVYLAFSRGDSVKLAGYSTFHNTTLGSTNVLDMNGQWNVSETVREQKYDGYGAHSSYENAVRAIQQAYAAGEEIPYAGYYDFTTYYSGNAPVFAQNSNFVNAYYAGSTNGQYFGYSGVLSAGDETTLKHLRYYHTGTNAALFRTMVYEVHRRADGSVDYMDVIVQTISEDLGLTRYYPVKLSYPDVSVDKTAVQYKTEADSYYTDAEFSNAQIDGEMQTVYEVPKGTESNFSMLTQYSTTALSAPFTQYNFAAGSSKPETQTTFNYDSLFTVEFCPEDGNTFTHIGNAAFTSGVGYRLTTDKSAPAQVTATMNRVSDTSVSMTLNGNATMGYYRITPVFAKTEYFYLYEEAVKFAESLDAGVSITGLDKGYQIIEEKSDRGYTIYKTIMYMAYESTIIHKRANDDSYLRNIFMSNAIGSTVNLSSINADAVWDSTNPYALAESNQRLEEHKSVDGQTNTIRFSDGKIAYNADPLTDDTDTCLENVNSFVVYSYISTSRRIDGVQTDITEAYLDMHKDYLPGNSTLYYLNGAELNAEGDIIEGTGEWTPVEFDSNRQVVESQKEFFRYTHFADDSDVKEAKMFKVVAENGNVSYYTINALQNKRNKSIRVNVGDFVKSGTAIVEQDSGTQENLSALLENYGTFSVSLNCMVDASAATVQTGYYTETGTDGNNFHNLKFGNYDIILNVPESAGYEYEVYYFGSGNKVELERSPDNPNAYRLPLRFKNLIGEGNSIELCVSIKKQPQTAWGYMIHRIFQR